MSAAVETAPDDAQVSHARFDRIIAETRKFSAEQNKLAAEAATLNRDRKLAPVVVLASIISGVIVALLTWVLTNYKLFIPHG